MFGITVHALRGGRLVHAVLAVFHCYCCCRAVFGRSVLRGGSILDGGGGSILLCLAACGNSRRGDVVVIWKSTGCQQHHQSGSEVRGVMKTVFMRGKENEKEREKNTSGEVRVHYFMYNFFARICSL